MDVDWKHWSFCCCYCSDQVIEQKYIWRGIDWIGILQIPGYFISSGLNTRFVARLLCVVLGGGDAAGD